MRKTLCKNSANLIREQDYFGVPVNLSYKGSSSYNTYCGGIVTILVVIACSVSFCISLHETLTNPIYEHQPIS